MEQLNPKKSYFSRLEMVVLLLCFSICLTGAFLLPVDQCPDEKSRLMLSEWIVKTGTLPTGNEPEVMIPGWGYSYALYPYLSAIVGAAFKKAATCFTDSPRILLAASRMCSVLAVTFCCFFCLHLGHRLFERKSSAVLLAVLVCFLPQVMFLGMYQNNDALSLCAVSMMLYYLVEGYDCKWPVTSCIGLAVSFSIGLLSYYSIYGWLLMGALFSVLAVLLEAKRSDNWQLLFKRAILILGICLLLAGWFFIRNAMLHDGDFLGFVSEHSSRKTMQEQGHVLYDGLSCRNDGMSVIQFLRFKNYEWVCMTADSFVGVFGYMIYYLSSEQYCFYSVILGGGVLYFLAVLLRCKLCRRDSLLLLMMMVSSGISITLSFCSSYVRDYQPQGRYVITLILPLAYMLSYGMDKTTVTVQGSKPGKTSEFNTAAAVTVLWLSLFVWAALGTMSKMIA